MPAHASDPSQIDLLLAKLRAAGLRVGVAEEVRVYFLLPSQPDIGTDLPHTLAAVLAFLVFLLGYTPCVATLAAQRHEVGLRWTLVGAGFQLALAWTLAVTVFQIGSRLGGLL